MFLNLQSLASAIAATKVLTAQQVVKNEAGEEVSSGQSTHFDCAEDLTKYSEYPRENY